MTLIFVILYLLPVPTTGEPVEDLAQEWSRFVIVNGVKIHYVEEFGEGDYTFILLHGFGASVFSWREVFKELSKYGRVVGFDRPGFGLTERVVMRARSNLMNVELSDLQSAVYQSINFIDWMSR
ncbi:MAG: hypothetical protein QXP80_02200 [Zestosphaera sp.]